MAPRPNGADTTLKADKQRAGLIQLDPGHPDVSLACKNLPNITTRPSRVKPAPPPRSQSQPAQSQTEIPEKVGLVSSKSEPVNSNRADRGSTLKREPKPEPNNHVDLSGSHVFPQQHSVLEGKISNKTAQLINEPIQLSSASESDKRRDKSDSTITSV